jgi:dimethylaniline monooxygenase (N-oxide forming)
LEKYKDEWKYTSLKDAPLPLSEKRHGPSASTSTSTTTLGKERVGDSGVENPKPLRAPALYKGMIPAKSLLKRDVAVNGAMVCIPFFHGFSSL